nr:hypothetical protein [Reinekea blandensis]
MSVKCGGNELTVYAISIEYRYFEGVIRTGFKVSDGVLVSL